MVAHLLMAYIEKMGGYGDCYSTFCTGFCFVIVTKIMLCAFHVYVICMYHTNGLLKKFMAIVHFCCIACMTMK